MLKNVKGQGHIFVIFEKLFLQNIPSSISVLLEDPFCGCLSGAVGSVDVWCSARQSC